MKKLLLTILTFGTLSVYSQQGEFKVLESFDLTGLNEQVIADTLWFEQGDLVAYRESFGVLLIVKNEITVRTTNKVLKQLEAEAKIKILSEKEEESKSIINEYALLKKINAKLNFLIGTAITGIIGGIISVARLLKTD